jgi:hypothetical protein
MPTRDTIASYYRQYLGRDPDTAGLDYWNNAAGSGMSLADIENSIKGSSEFQNRNAISGLYDKYLGRTADTEGLAYWQDRANSGMSLADIENSIQASSEFQNRGAGTTTATAAARGGRVVQNNGIAGIRRK